MSGMLAHGIKTTRSRRITVFHWVCWIGGGFISLLMMVTLHSLVALFVVPLFVVVGWPITDGPTIHEKLYRLWRAHRQRHTDNGIRRHAPLRRDPDRESVSKLDKAGLATAQVRNSDRSLRTLPMFTDPDRNYLTLVIIVEGWGQAYVEGDATTKYNQELQLVTGLVQAVGATKNPDVTIVQGRMYRPADKELAFLYNNRRLSPAVRQAAADAAAGQNGYDPVDALLGQHVYDAEDDIYSFGGDGIHYTALRMPWPRKKLRRINLLDARAFAKSDIWTTISRIMQVYRNLDIGVRFNTDPELSEFFQLVFNLKDLRHLRYYKQRDRELRDVLGESYNGEDLPYPLTVRSDTDGSGHIECGGTFFAAGYASKLNRPDLPPGLQDDLAVLPDDVFAISATYSKLPKSGGLTGDKSKLTGQEIVQKTIAGNQPIPYLSTPGTNAKIDEIVEMRQRLARSGGRSGEYFILFSVAASSPDDLEDSWNTLVRSLADLYDLQRAYNPDEIEDVLLAQIGIALD